MIKWLEVCFVLIACFITPAQAQIVVLDGRTLIDAVIIEATRIKLPVQTASSRTRKTHRSSKQTASSSCPA